MNTLAGLAAASLLIVGCERSGEPIGPTPFTAAPVGQGEGGIVWEASERGAQVRRGVAAVAEQVDAMVARVEGRAQALARASRSQVEQVKRETGAVASQMAARARQAAAATGQGVQAIGATAAAAGKRVGQAVQGVTRPAGPGTAAPPEAVDWSTTDADHQLNQALRQAFALDPVLAAASADVQIRTFHGTVTLSGTVASAAIRSALLAQAGAHAGRDRVVDLLDVR